MNHAQAVRVDVLDGDRQDALRFGAEIRLVLGRPRVEPAHERLDQRSELGALPRRPFPSGVGDAVRSHPAIGREVGLAVVLGAAAARLRVEAQQQLAVRLHLDRKSTRLNSSHLGISYAVFCLKKKKTTLKRTRLTNDEPSMANKRAHRNVRTLFTNRLRPPPSRRYIPPPEQDSCTCATPGCST